VLVVAVIKSPRCPLPCSNCLTFAVNAPLTTPEEAQAFLADMRDKSKMSQIVPKKPPADLSGAGVDAWYMQQKKREKELRKRRQEAEALLRGYRATYDAKGTLHGGDDECHASALPVGRHMFGAMGLGRATVRETMEDPDSDVYESEGRVIGRLKIVETRGDEQIATGGAESSNKQVLSRDVPDCDTALRKQLRNESTIFSPPVKPSAVPTPARHMVPDEREWREFVTTGENDKFAAEKDRYHIYASYACPGSHRCLIVRALKGLDDCVSVTIVHPTWQLTKQGTDEEQRGWVFGNPDGEPLTNTAGRGGPFPSAFPGNEPDPEFGAFSIRDIYEQAGDNAGKYVVPFLWDKKLKTVVNNESSDISYMLNSSFNAFAKNPDIDLYTEDDPDPEKLNEVIEWLSPLMIHGVYRCGFAKNQLGYDKAISELTQAFDKADSVLQHQRFLTGDTLTDADIRLFVTLLRFDEVYAFYFRANTRLVILTPSLLNYCREIYQMDGVAATCNMDHIKTHFYSSHAEWNKFSIVPQGLGFMRLLNLPHDRDDIPSVEGSDVVEPSEVSVASF